MYIQLEGQIIYYDIEGSGPPMIMLHGNSEDHTIFDKLVEKWKDRYTMYLIDSRGHGLSATPKEYHYEDMAMDVYRFIEALGIENPIILGFSDGAITALLLGIYHSDMLSKIIACGANLNPKGIRWGERRAIKKEYKRTGDSKKYMMLCEPDIKEKELSKISVPTVIVAGERDCIVPSHTRSIADAIPKAKLVIAPKESHSGYIVHSDYLDEIL